MDNIRRAMMGCAPWLAKTVRLPPVARPLAALRTVCSPVGTFVAPKGRVTVVAGGVGGVRATVLPDGWWRDVQDQIVTVITESDGASGFSITSE